jgi:outer membrane receptor protein involved in Fe transport
MKFPTRVAAGVFALLAAPSIVEAQQEKIVSGRIVDGAGQPLATATATLRNPAGGAIAGLALTDADGRFAIAGAPAGSFVLVVSRTGFEPTERPVLVGALNNVYDLGDLVLSRQAAAMGVTIADDVIVMARRRASGLSADLDKNSFQLDDNFAQAGGSILDAMKALPGVAVTQEGTVSLRGSDRVTILVDGRPSALTGFGNQSGLGSIPAANIESIEVINNPSSRFDSTGMAGIINIVYRKTNQSGLSGDVTLSTGVGALQKRRADLPTDLGSFSNNWKLLPSATLNYQTDTTRYLLQGEVLGQRNLPNNEFTTRFYDDGRIIDSQVPENREQIHYILKGGMDRTLGTGDTFGLTALYDFEHHKDVAQVPFIDRRTMQRLRYWFWEEQEDTGNVNASATYKKQFAQPGHTLSVNLQYNRAWEDEAYYLNEDSPVRVGTDSTHIVAIEHTAPLLIDYVRPLANGRIEAGVKLQTRWMPVTYDVVRGVQSVIYPGLGDTSEWGENTYAVYGNYVFDRPKYSIEAGLRGEQTDVHYDLDPANIYYPTSDRYGYFKLYPNVRLTYKFDADNTVSAFLNKRVDRPSEAELRIFPKYDDPELLKVGNPYLRPQFTTSYELTYRRAWEGGSASTAFYYRDIEDPFTRVFAIDATNPNYDIVNRIYQNVGKATNTGIELIGQQKIASRLTLSGSANFYQIEFDAFDATLLFPTRRPFHVAPSQDTTWDAKLSALLKLPADTEVQASFVYYADKTIAQGVQAARSSFDLGLKKPLSDRLDLTVSATDIFNQFGIEQTIQGAGFRATYENHYQTQGVTAGLKYRF